MIVFDKLLVQKVEKYKIPSFWCVHPF